MKNWYIAMSLLVLLSCTNLNNPYDETNPSPGGGQDSIKTVTLYDTVTRIDTVIYRDTIWHRIDGSTGDSVITRIVYDTTIIRRDSVVVRDSVVIRDSVVVWPRDSVVVRDSIVRRDSVVVRDSVVRRDSVVVIIQIRDSVRVRDSTAVRIKDSIRIRDSLRVRDSIAVQVITAKKLGTQTWTLKNLDIDAVTGSWYYGNLPTNGPTYGMLYTWPTAKNVCAKLGKEWRLPTNDDWDGLVDYVTTGLKFSHEVAGQMLKTRTGWEYTGNGTDNYGFSALPAGIRYSNGNFYDLRFRTHWWSATESADGKVYTKDIRYSDGILNTAELDSDYGLSVRCVKS